MNVSRALYEALKAANSLPDRAVYNATLEAYRVALRAEATMPEAPDFPLFMEEATASLMGESFEAIEAKACHISFLHALDYTTCDECGKTMKVEGSAGHWDYHGNCMNTD